MYDFGKVWQAPCPECGTMLRFRRPLDLGAYVICPACDGELEVIGLAPLEFSLAFDDTAYPRAPAQPVEEDISAPKTGAEPPAREP